MGNRPAWWVPRENSFFRKTLGESVPLGKKIGVFGIQQRFVSRDRGQAQGCDPMGVVEGLCGYPAG